MPVELESKTAVESFDAVRAVLRDAGAAYVGRRLETNRFFDRPDGRLRRADSGLRIRSVETLDGPDEPATLTYKGPIQEAAFKRREEIELRIDDPQAMARVLETLGYRQTIVFEKRRESWRLGGCCVELDEVPRLGRFVEIEGPTEADIRSVLAALALEERPSIRRGYVSMLSEMAGPGAESPIAFRFNASA